MTKTPRFSPKTVQFIKKASQQKKPDWLDRNREDYETLLLQPLQHLAKTLKTELSTYAPGYHFPQKGIGRLKRPINRVKERGGGFYKNWLTYSASRPRASRFENNPNLFFMIDTDDPKEGILVAGGLYMPSSRQTRAIREAISKDATAFDQLFSTKEFSRRFKGGFSDERISSRPARGYDPNHPKMNWLRLQAFFVWRPYSKKEFSSPKFAKILAQDWRQILRLNELLDQAIGGRLSSAPRKEKGKKQDSDLLGRLEQVGVARQEMDF